MESRSTNWCILHIRAIRLRIVEKIVVIISMPLLMNNFIAHGIEHCIRGLCNPDLMTLAFPDQLWYVKSQIYAQIYGATAVYLIGIQGTWMSWNYVTDNRIHIYC